MSIGIVMSQNSPRANRRLPIGRSAGAAGRNGPSAERPGVSARYSHAIVGDGDRAVNAAKKAEGAPPPVISAPPERELERRLKRDPGDADAKADVGSDESMDASDPPAATQPGASDDPAPSSGFPDNAEVTRRHKNSPVAINQQSTVFPRRVNFWPRRSDSPLIQSEWGVGLWLSYLETNIAA